jgi:hypothetical protein
VAAIYIPACIQGTLFAENTDGGQQLLHVMDFQGPNAAVSALDCQNVCNILVAWWSAVYRAAAATNVRAVRAVAVARDQFEGATWEIPMSTDGTRIGTPNPTEVTLCVKMAGNNIGRSRRGRHYMFPAVGTDLVSATTDHFTNVYVNAAVSVFTDLLTRSNAAGYPFKVASNVRRTMYPISRVVAVDDLVDKMGRRSLGRGR